MERSLSRLAIAIVSLLHEVVEVSIQVGLSHFRVASKVLIKILVEVVSRHWLLLLIFTFTVTRFTTVTAAALRFATATTTAASITRALAIITLLSLTLRLAHASVRRSTTAPTSTAVA
jgi:hypothetical protein